MRLRPANRLILIVLLCIIGAAATGVILRNDSVRGPGHSLASPAGQGAAPPVTLVDGDVPIDSFLDLSAPDAESVTRAITSIGQNWDDSYTAMILESLPRMRSSARAEDLIRMLEAKTGQAFGVDTDGWYQWLWGNDFGAHPRYPDFKAGLYSVIDPRFAAHFRPSHPAVIRLDEIRWGGVVRDGIPPLVKPRMIPADKASYLADDHVVFGIEINGDARAYPKRILAWHEMVKDTVGGVSVNGVYCTLCGAMILYRTEHNGVQHELGTSGFLYRSNKLMYDRATESLWSTTYGEPVVGPLVGKGIKLEPLHVVTSTWATWRKLHPKTTVLSLATGHARDYREGAAYRSYFATDKLVFTVPELDRRLRNKAEVLALRFGGSGDLPVAIDAEFLATRPVYHGQLGAQRYVVLTDAGGANRVYDAGDYTFSAYDKDGTSVRDQTGWEWVMHESALKRAGGNVQLKRLPAHRAFWFGWFAAHPDTRLITQE